MAYETHNHAEPTTQHQPQPSWNTHIDSTTKKANNTLVVLKRNISSCPSKIKAHTMLYNSGETNGACVVWDPVAKRNIYALEMVQRRAARFTLGDYRTIMQQRYQHVTDRSGAGPP
jgi:hypothetical protein